MDDLVSSARTIHEFLTHTRNSYSQDWFFVLLFILTFTMMPNFVDFKRDPNITKSLCTRYFCIRYFCILYLLSDICAPRKCWLLRLPNCELFSSEPFAWGCTQNANSFTNLKTKSTVLHYTTTTKNCLRRPITSQVDFTTGEHCLSPNTIENKWNLPVHFYVNRGTGARFLLADWLHYSLKQTGSFSSNHHHKTLLCSTCGD